MEDVIINRVAESGLITLSLEDYYPKEPIKVFDIKDYLFMGMIIKEKDFREALKKTDWEQYRNAHVAVVCTADAIIPVWAYMLITTYLQPIAASIFQGDEKKLAEFIVLQNIQAINADDYTDKRIIIKGCGNLPITESAYVALTSKLLPFVKSIMYGEPCSTVPVYKKR